MFEWFGQHEGIRARNVDVLGRVGRSLDTELIQQDAERMRADDDGAGAKQTVIVQRRQGCMRPSVGELKALAAEQSHVGEAGPRLLDVRS